MHALAYDSVHIIFNLFTTNNLYTWLTPLSICQKILSKKILSSSLLLNFFSACWEKLSWNYSRLLLICSNQSKFYEFFLSSYIRGLVFYLCLAPMIFGTTYGTRSLFFRRWKKKESKIDNKYKKSISTRHLKLKKQVK